MTDFDDILKDRIAVLKSNRDRAKEALARIKVRPVGISGASKPGATTTKVACRPHDGHALFDGPPLSILPISHAEHQNHHEQEKVYIAGLWA